jgi:hypothetical protein
LQVENSTRDALVSGGLDGPVNLEKALSAVGSLDKIFAVWNDLKPELKQMVAVK